MLGLHRARRLTGNSLSSRATGGVVTAGIMLLTAMGTMAAGEVDTTSMTVETILAKHAAARGGEEAWKQVRSLRYQGIWEAFSTENPSTIQRLRPNLYRLDLDIFGGPATVACDGEKAWLKGASLGVPDGQEVGGGWKSNLLHDAVFGPRLLHLAGNGAEIELLGREDVEGIEAWKLKVTPPGGDEETWFLDAATFLELMRISRIHDVFSGPNIVLEMETFFMEFKPVGDVVIPFREERHFGTRYQVQQAETIEVNPEIDAAIFAVPASPQEAPSPESDAVPPAR
jgi:hypothetical protein